MGTVPHNISKWLHNALTGEYHDVNRTYFDVIQTLSHHSSFALRTDVYIYENGSSALLLNLQGTLPVNFRGTTYAFPISIWIPQEYPNIGPIGFVTPTKEMAVRPGQFISGEGRIYHPYLAGWSSDVGIVTSNSIVYLEASNGGTADWPDEAATGNMLMFRPQRSNLPEFLSILQGVFEREPPVVARKEPHAMRLQERPRNDMPPPVPPLPPELGRVDQGSSSTPYVQPPPLPPKPFDSGERFNTKMGSPPPLPPHPVRDDSTYGPLQSDHSNGLFRGPGSLPRPPPQRTILTADEGLRSDQHRPTPRIPYQQPRQEPPTPPGAWTNYDGQNGYTQGSMVVEQQHFTQQKPSQQTVGRPVNTDSSITQDDRGTPHYHNKPQWAFQHHRQQQPENTQQQRPRPSGAKAPEDLLTSPFEHPLATHPVDIVPPPIPPNPQKDALLSALSQTLTAQIHSTHDSNLSAIPLLRAQQAALTSTLNSVNAEMSRLKDLESMLCSNEDILHKAMRDADKVLEDAKRRNVPNVDEVLVAPSVVAGELYQSVAEEKAIEDCRGVLGKALDRGRIGGSVWAKQTRSLAREEFLKKAIIKKISRGMGLMAGGRDEANTTSHAS